MASPSHEAKKTEARKRGAVAAAATVASVAIIAAGAPPIVGAAGVAGSAYLGYRWLRYRIKEALRF